MREDTPTCRGGGRARERRRGSASREEPFHFTLGDYDSVANATKHGQCYELGSTGIALLYVVKVDRDYLCSS